MAYLLHISNKLGSFTFYQMYVNSVEVKWCQNQYFDTQNNFQTYLQFGSVFRIFRRVANLSSTNREQMNTATGTTRPATLPGPPHSHTSTSIACIFSHIHLHCLNLLTCPLTLLTHSLTQPNQSHTFTYTA